MKVMIVSLFFVEYAVELANALSNNNRIYLVLSKKCVERTMGDSFQKKVSHRVQYELLPDFSVKHSSLIKTIINIRRSCKAFRPDIVHIQSGRNLQNLFYLLFSFKPTVHTLHDVVLHPGSQSEFDKPWRRWTRDKLRRYAYNKIIVHGNLLKKKFISQHKKAPEDVHVVPHGCLFSFLTKKKHAIDEEPYTILFFGRMEEYKGLKDLIEAEPLISREIKNIKIVIAGEGIDLEKQSINIKSNAHFEVHHHFIANDEVPYFFERAALIVLPYIEASQSGIISMAYAFGKPVVSTDVGSLGEMVEDGITGLLVPKGDVKSFADAVIFLLKNPAKRKIMGKNALHAAKTKFSWKRIAAMTEDVYTDTIE